MKSTAQVKGNICVDSAKPLYPEIKVGSEFWFSWLREPETRSFHFESDSGKFTARKEERATSTNEYWYAYRKVKGQLRKVYLGAMDELTSDRLEQVAAEISQPGLEFYRSRKSYTTKKEGLHNNEPETSSETFSYPTNKESNWVTNSSEIKVLTIEVEQLRSQLVVLQEEARVWQQKVLEADTLVSGLEDEVDLLREQLEYSQSQQPDYEAARDRVLAKTRLGRQAPDYKRYKKGMDLLIAELQPQQLSKTTALRNDQDDQRCERSA